MSKDDTLPELISTPSDETLQTAISETSPEKQEAAPLESAPFEQLVQQYNEATQKSQENWEKYLRAQAELDNFQRRAEKDLQNAHKYALEKFSKELLTVMDSLEL